MNPKRVTIYRDPSYPDRLALAQAVLRDHQPRGWLRPAVAAAMMAALGAGMMGCPKKPSVPIEPQRPPTEQPGGTVAPGSTVAPGDTFMPPLPGILAPPAYLNEEMMPPDPSGGCTVAPEPKK